MSRLNSNDEQLLLSEEIRARIVSCAGALPAKFILVRIAEQRLLVVHDEQPCATYPVGTSRYGVGSEDGSLKTPRGIHRIVEKIGDGAPVGRVFRDRIDTGEDWSGDEREDNLILTRILRLEGLEEGVNRGPGIDSFDRCIYVHGTNQECRVGTPLSHGCVCMKNTDIVELFDSVEVGTIVAID